MIMAQLMPLPLTVSRFSKIQIGFTFLVPAYPGNPGQNPESRKMVVCMCVLCQTAHTILALYSEQTAVLMRQKQGLASMIYARIAHSSHNEIYEILSTSPSSQVHPNISRPI